MSRLLRLAPLLVLLLLLSSRPAFATTVVPLLEEDLTDQADAIVIGKVSAIVSHWEPHHARIVTTITIAVNEVLKGEVTTADVTLTQHGGTVGGVHAWIHGNPEFRRGERVLVFLTQARDGTLRVTQLYQGKFSIAVDPSTFEELAERDPNPSGVQVLAVPGATPPVDTWKLEDLKQRIGNRAARDGRRRKLRPSPPVSADALSTTTTTFTFMSSPARWFEPDGGRPVPMYTNRSGEPATPGGGFEEVRAALNAWTMAAGSSLDFRDAGLTDAVGLRYDAVNSISFRDPLGLIDPPYGCRGTLAIGGYYRSNETRTINNTVFYRIIDADVATADGWQGCGFYENRANFAEVITHELGHALGFGHNLDSDATMAPVAHFDGRGASLRASDIAGLVFLYPGSTGGGTPTPSMFTLSVSRAGASGGLVTSSPAGISCGTDCTHDYASGTVVTLIASAPAGTAFAGWSGACTGTGACSVTMTTARSVTATFVAVTGKPDLRVTALGAPPASVAPGGAFVASDTVVNYGTGSAGSSRTRYYLSVTGTRGATDVLLAGSRLLPTLVAGAGSSGTATVTVPSTTAPGTYYVIACTDDTMVVAESSETNNCRASTGRVTVGASVLADLVTLSVWNVPPSARRGSAFLISDVVRNQGFGSAASSTLRYYLSLDTVRNSGDVRMQGSRSVPALVPGAYSSGMVYVGIPSTLATGYYYVIGCADDLSVVAESSNTNNCRTSTSRVSVMP
jgi:hypothetical protein